MVSRKIADRIEFPPEHLERTRQFIFLRYPEYKEALAKALQPSNGMITVDVGCGTGAFSRLLAEWVKPSGKVVGVDIDERLLEVAKKRTVETGYSNLMEFRKGDAYNLPLDNNFADLSFCHALLWVLESPVNALREMARVVKPGRLVAASEPDEGLFVYYDREDERYTKLVNIDAEASARGSGSSTNLTCTSDASFQAFSDRLGSPTSELTDH